MELKELDNCRSSLGPVYEMAASEGGMLMGQLPGERLERILPSVRLIPSVELDLDSISRDGELPVGHGTGVRAEYEISEGHWVELDGLLFELGAEPAELAA